MSSRPLRLLTGLAQGPQVVAVGLLVFMAGGVLTALLAARLLPSASYTVYAAFSGLLGVLVLGPASSLEQEAALRGARSRHGGRVQTFMVRRAAVVWLLLAAVALVPVGGWQARLLGEHRALAVGLVAAGAPVVLLLAVRRGLAGAAARFRLVAALHALAGVAMLLLPLVLHAAGVPLIDAFLAGAVLAWLPPLLLSLGLGLAAEEDRAAPHPVGGTTAWLVTANLLVLANLLAVPPLLRWHVRGLGPEHVADMQLLVSVSRLATTAVLGFLPLLLGRWGDGSGARVPVRAAAAAAVLGLLAVLGAAVLGEPFVGVLTGRDAAFSLAENLLATVPVVLLCPALVLMGAVLARGRHALAALAWGAGLVCLAALLRIDPDGQAEPLLLGIAAASAVPPAVLLAGLLGGRGRRRVLATVAA